MTPPHARVAAIAVALSVVLLNVRGAEAALPPYWQSAHEIEAIIGDPRVHDAFKYEEPILSITTTGNDVYEIKTPRCTLDVTIVDKPLAAGAPVMVGPRQFELQIGTADCE